jgi:anti-sigma regulatory factor (Ser/Thr protein kinase)
MPSGGAEGQMSADTTSDFLLTGFDEADASALTAALSEMGRGAIQGDPVNDCAPSCVLAAAYDESSLRGQRAAALDDPRPWGLCVPHRDRALVAAASSAREGRMLLLPPERRELKRFLAAVSEDARETGRAGAFFVGLSRCEAAFSWKTRDIDVSPACRRLAMFLREAGFYADRAEEDLCALSLEEALVNSIEHGNLELDSSLRSDDIASEDLYEAERERRMADPAYGERRIDLSLSVSGNEARIVIQDQGAGFDASRLGAEPTGMDVSGKGYWLIRRPFDSAEHGAGGRRLALAKRRPGAGT